MTLRQITFLLIPIVVLPMAIITAWVIVQERANLENRCTAFCEAMSTDRPEEGFAMMSAAYRRDHDIGQFKEQFDFIERAFF